MSHSINESSKSSNGDESNRISIKEDYLNLIHSLKDIEDGLETGMDTGSQQYNEERVPP